jgi:hypothetical protein
MVAALPCRLNIEEPPLWNMPGTITEFGLRDPRFFMTAYSSVG